MPDGGFRTGDIGKMDKDGYLYITGRIKEQYKLSNGKYVVPSPLEEQIKLSPLINQVFIFGDNKVYNVALIGVDKVQLKKHLKREKNIEITDEEIYKSEIVKQLIDADIKTYQEDFKGFEKIKKFALVKEEWGQENGYLTPSMKLKRAFVINNYKDTIEKLYN
ncbi:MAG: AMP-binding protein [Bacteriovoracaceae bacterium]